MHAFASLRPLTFRLRLPTALLRALFATSILFVWILSAMPSKAPDARRLARAPSRQIIAGVHQVLVGVGSDVSRDDVVDAVVESSASLLELRKRLLRPFDALFDFAGLGQRWGLFLQGNREAFRLQIEAQTTDGQWQLVYRARQYDALGLDRTLAFRRLRGIYNPRSKSRVRGQYNGFVTWLARHVAAQNPEYRRLRVSMERLRLGSRNVPSQPLGVHHKRERALGAGV